ncbi:MAG: DUF4329 domain-containing protein [Devosiaceae bacterium]|nr:DUF4329 domain-containing protein [Devosiaceae bacterium]
MKKTALLQALIFGMVMAFIPGAYAQDQEEINFVTNFFNQLQPKSIAENTEYCGYFGIDENDNFVATTPAKGDTDSCLANDPPENLDLFATYHTHGAYMFDADSELPSLNDLEADIDEYLDGYVATPGGRIWFNSVDRETAIMLCGRNCTVSDSEYVADTEYPVNNSYTVQQLRQRESE